jgi:hypothetical protein
MNLGASLFLKFCNVVTLLIIHEELVKFGCMLGRKVKKFQNPAIFLRQVGTNWPNLTISKEIPENLTTLALFFHKNPLYALQGIFFLIR